MKIQPEVLNAATKLRQGDMNYFDQLYKNTVQYVYARCRLASRSEQEALDLMQEVYIAVYKNIRTLKDPSCIYAWLKAIILRQSTKMTGKYVKENITPEFHEDMCENIEDETSDIENEIIKKENADAVRQCIAELSPEHRMVIMAYYYEEMKIEDIAECAGISIGTVKSRLFSARKKLRESIVSSEKKYGIRLHSVSIPIIIFALKQLLVTTFINDSKASMTFDAICKTLNIGNAFYYGTPSVNNTAGYNIPNTAKAPLIGSKHSMFTGHAAISAYNKWLLPVIIGLCGSAASAATGIYFATHMTNDSETLISETQSETTDDSFFSEAPQTNTISSSEPKNNTPTIQNENPVRFDASVYDPVLKEYGEYDYYGFCNYNYVSYILTTDPFTAAWQPYLGRPVYYTFYDFFDDGLPELLLSVYIEESDSYTILDIYGTDGKKPISLIDEETAGTIELFMCENGIIKSYSTSEDNSSELTLYFLVENGGTSAKLTDDIYRDENDMYYHIPPDYIADTQISELFFDNEYTISRQEYDSIASSYPENETAKHEYEWKSVTEFYDPFSNDDDQSLSSENNLSLTTVDEYYGDFLEYFKNSEADGFAGAPLELINSVFWDSTVFPGGYAESDTDLYYTVIDLMGDGIPELFIGDGNTIYGYYGIDKYDQLIPMITLDGPGTEYRIDICENGYVRVIRDDGTYHSVSYHRADTSLYGSTTEAMLQTTDGKYFTCAIDPSYDWLFDLSEYATEEDFDSFEKKYPLKSDIQWYKLSDYDA